MYFDYEKLVAEAENQTVEFKKTTALIRSGKKWHVYKSISPAVWSSAH